MSTAIVIGTPSSGLTPVWELLEAAGIERAGPARMHNLWTEEIGQKPVSVMSSSDGVDRPLPLQEEARNEELLDLILSNADKQCWGWAGPHTAAFADHWRRINADTKFILVYGHPVLGLVKKGTAPITAESLEEAGKSWHAYYSALLDFYKRNKEDCLLVNGQQVLMEPGPFLGELSTCLGLEPLPNEVSAEITQQASQAIDHVGLLAGFTVFGPGTDARQLYDELQACSKYPYLPTEHDILALNSYKALVDENALLLLQLHQLQEELELFHIENEILRSGEGRGLGANPGTVEYGAVNRIKRHLSYRLGSTLIAGSKTIGGILTMPWALFAQIRAFKEDQKQLRAMHLPPIESCGDAEEAELMKRHLSYRLGAVLISRSKSPFGWLSLPFAITCEVRAFNRERKLLVANEHAD